jgi:hypothetical protein
LKRQARGLFFIALLLAGMVDVATVPAHRTSFHALVFEPGGADRATLSGEDEVLVLPTPPCSVVLFDAAHGTVRALGDLSARGATAALTFEAAQGGVAALRLLPSREATR